MSRHRNVRTMDFDEEYEGYYSCYGHSVEDDSCISPCTEAQFLYDRKNEQQNVSSFLKSQPTAEAEFSSEDSSAYRHSYFFEGYSNLSDVDQGKMQSCVEAMQDVVGDTVSEVILCKAAADHSFDLEKALNAVLCESSISKGSQYNKIDEFANDELLGKGTLITSDGEKKAFLKSNALPETNVKSNEDDSSCLQEKIASTVEKIATIQPGIISASAKSFPTRKDTLHLYKDERVNGKPLLNLVVIGHVDAGKSTLMGHMLYSLGFVPKKAMHKYEQESKKLGKASFMYAWVLDETSEERNRGITMDVAQAKFETCHKKVNLLDAPGHKDFIPNMIAGAAQADVAILVVDATCGEFETGFETGGQTREHTMLIRSLGVSQLAVAVNKMDNVSWEKKRYDDISNKLSLFLKQVGFKEKDVQFLPCSGLTGENLTKLLDVNDDLKNWYHGPSLVDIIDSFRAPERAISKPLRMCIGDVFKGMGSGFCVSGRIEAGFVQYGDKVLIMPAGEQAVVRAISIGETTVQHSFAGDHVVLQLAAIDITSLNFGSIICDLNMPAQVTSRFQARLVIFDINIPITKGFPVILHYQRLTEQAFIKKLISQLHRSTGELLKKRPRCLTKNSSAVVEIEVSRPICIELYSDFKDLGRFMLRFSGSTIAAGLVTKII